ncbi:ABC transporter ATP-binding protein [Streptomyces sp. AD681]|uniref:ABC transporter ATP-binding protein n=1 Tax=Streptomyces sp. AD681 TaxID=3019069 RepID=UPI0022F1DD28|nr:ABC transporter ATP-binding protein [Streptomyces sp. AD681]MDA5145664.1 ABC transporter ATP-binding protein [Streptomyces sp. AD681]
MLLDIDNLTLRLTDREARPLLSEVSLQVAAGEVVGLVGESGSGKSTTARAALRMLPAAADVTGTVRHNGRDVLTMSPAELRRHRARNVSMIYQDPRASLNPVRRIGDFLTERLVRVLGQTKNEANANAVRLLGDVGLSDPERRLRQYPHELSGGMLQRVVIAAGLATDPGLLLADESTSALDVTTQAEILVLLKALQAEHGMGLLFITHDLHLAAAYCDRVYVMYAGRVAEHQSARDLFTQPRHPYTRGLLDCSPALGESKELRPIPGRPPSLSDTRPGCPFAPRCAHAEDACTSWTPELSTADGVEVSCRRAAVLERSLV